MTKKVSNKSLEALRKNAAQAKALAKKAAEKKAKVEKQEAKVAEKNKKAKAKATKKAAKAIEPKVAVLEQQHVDLVVDRMKIDIDPKEKEKITKKLKALREEIHALGGTTEIGSFNKNNGSFTAEDREEARKRGEAKKIERKKKKDEKKNAGNKKK